MVTLRYKGDSIRKATPALTLQKCNNAVNYFCVLFVITYILNIPTVNDVESTSKVCRSQKEKGKVKKTANQIAGDRTFLVPINDRSNSILNWVLKFNFVKQALVYSKNENLSLSFI